jgi:hypothetical protein
METFQAAFQGKDKPVRVLYSKGEDLIVERTVLVSDSEDGDPFLTPYQMIRQHAEIEIQEAIDNPVLACCKAAQEVRRQGFSLIGVVCRTTTEVTSWIVELDISNTFGVEIYTDPECPEGCLFFCGSLSGPMIRDFEKAILCRME